ncbi:MAG TPA: DnaJ domain-containing protein [Caulobacteraceae bacterium]|nr:DnaJ domain-containing protein [Caulobacteraceae bacterium]
MTVLALGALVLALMIGLGRRPLASRAAWRLLGRGLAVAAVAGAAFAAARGEWLGGAMLIAAAIWLAAGARGPKPPSTAGGLAEAAAILGVAESADRGQIEAAYRRLIMRVHPDQGGAPGLAAELNRAREIMLAARPR